ncbi:DUF4124 domain-containing protein [Noviherbaspirillum cavernae]|uniref:DUF4124 domain-containing protein n=1 Tax=Noviherbaspirillum cavernae TaxID=2320862 RepID=A0A418X159_9BURK|nr:DUF4124 domain-containing protein [Noviherbaspirillum cavernae]RJG06180.1 DUF4124 domain-containing protein [Noviherbaspirillum cavernae]
MTRLHLKNVMIALATLCVTSSALGQYVWLNEKGVKQYSDMPPPASVPESRILKVPGKTLGSSKPNPAPDADRSVDAATATKAPLTTAEKNADFQKRRSEQEQKEKKAAEDEKVAAAKARNCENARDYQRSLESGVRITKSDKNGERTFLSDEQRTRELQDSRRILEDCK